MNCSFAGMNYLGHAYLSFNSPPVLVGNMISDFLKGSARFVFSGKIQHGIVLHRMIDAFTDSHSATKKAMEVFRPNYRLYSGPIMDVLFDHYLANDPSAFGEVPLRQFVNNTYRQIEDHAAHLPNRFLQMFTYMKTEDWLYNYRYVDGISRSLHGLLRRSSFIRETDTAVHLFKNNYDFLNECFSELFKDVKQFAKQSLEQMEA